MTGSAIRVAQFDPVGMVVIYDEILAADAASFDVQNIPQEYKHLQIEFHGRGTVAAVGALALCRMNNDSGANYHQETLYGAGGSAGAAAASGQTSMQIGQVAGASAPTSYSGITSAKINDYAGTTFFKSAVGIDFHSRDASSSQVAETSGGIWLNAGAINRLTIYPHSGNWKAGSRLTIYGLGGALPATVTGQDPIFDTFGTPTTAFEFDTSSLAGLTALSNTPDVVDANTTVPGHFHLLDNGSGETVVGQYATAPSTPWTAITYMAGSSVRADYQMAGMFVGVSAPGAMDIWANHYSSGYMTVLFNCPNPSDITTPSVFQDTATLQPRYLAIRANSGTSVDYLWSRDGLVWTKSVAARNPGFTIATVGLAICSINTNGTAAAWDFLRMWNSALAFPGVA